MSPYARRSRVSEARLAGQAILKTLSSYLSDDRAKVVRKILAKFGIEIDDGVNGVFFPATTKSVNPKGALVHSTLHTNDYYSRINDVLKAAKNRADAFQKLKRIRETLLDGTLHHAKI